ncbi:BnaC01g39930D [Brassica napus]|uniref:BnaC01g39930D protein n=1 Tax=Brassica napus TaxID=3708 RepID=A0A078GU66_BRANA|nr:BnaC01g39930D [Brassica napus]
MKRARRKETTGTNQKRLTKKEDEKDPFSIIPLNLIVEILMKIPTKSVASLVLVSKKWLSIIRRKDFIKLYMSRSSNRTRLLFTIFRMHVREQFLQTCSQVDPSSNDHRHRLNIAQHRMHVYAFSPPIRGLICRQMDSKVVIANPSTGQLLTLPRVKTVRREEHQVYTLGGGQQKWRMIECEHPHLPPPTSCLPAKCICINGILYYYAWIQNEGALISFDLISEEFNTIKLPEDINCLVNYNGKIAISSLPTINGEVHIWVLEDASKQEWFRGTLSTGELIFSPVSCVKPFYFISYDLKENNAKKVVVEGIGDPHASLEVYFNHVESPMFLSN